MANELKQWRVRHPRVFFTDSGQRLPPGTFFEATEEEVKSQRWKVDLVGGETPPPADDAVAPEPKRRRGRPPKANRAILEPQDTAVM